LKPGAYLDRRRILESCTSPPGPRRSDVPNEYPAPSWSLVTAHVTFSFTTSPPSLSAALAHSMSVPYLRRLSPIWWFGSASACVTRV